MNATQLLESRDVVALGRDIAQRHETELPELAAALKVRPVDVRLVGAVCDLVVGISVVTPLVWDRDFYRALMYAATGDLAGEVRREALPALALIAAIPGADSYVQSNIRRLLRRLYERGVPLPPGTGVDWQPQPLATLADAWAVLLALTTTDDTGVVPAGGCPNVWEHLDGGTVVAGDALLAGFIAAHPRVLEQAVYDRRDELAATQYYRGRMALGQFFNSSGSGKLQPRTRTHAAFAADIGLRLFTDAQARKLFDHCTEHNSFHVASAWLAREPSAASALYPETRDVFRGLTDKTPLPVILPDDLSGHTPAQIEEALARYAGIPYAELYARLVPGALSYGRFVRDGERLGELIARDAATLRELGVARDVLADRLLAVLHAGSQPPFEVEAMAFAGHQKDPFHVYDVYYLNGRLGAVDFTIKRGDRELRGGTLQISLIRRACFFGGPGCYRIDPATAVAVLLG